MRPDSLVPQQNLNQCLLSHFPVPHTQEPFIYSAVNYVRVGSYAAVLWVALCLVLLCHQPGIDMSDDLAVAAWKSDMTQV